LALLNFFISHFDSSILSLRYTLISSKSLKKDAPMQIKVDRLEKELELLEFNL